MDSPLRRPLPKRRRFCLNKRFCITPGFTATICVMAWVDITFCGLFLLSVLVHEVGHMIMIKVLKQSIYGIRLQAAGALICCDCTNYRAEWICALSGPVASFLLGLLTFWWCAELAVISICLGLGNLLPIYPLDGGRALRACLLLRLQPASVERILQAVTFAVCILLMMGASWVTIALQCGLWPIFCALLVLWRVGTVSRENPVAFPCGRG